MSRTHAIRKSQVEKGGVSLLESDIQRAAVDYLRQRGEWVYENRSHVSEAVLQRFSGNRNAKGSPDVFVFLGRTMREHGMLLAIEFKRPGESLSPDQVLWKEELERRGHQHLTAFSVEDVIRYMEGERGSRL